jgi:hypothetical protein
MNRVFIGYDPRQPISFTVLAQSILSRATKPVAIVPLVIEQLDFDRQGLTPFTFSRFLVPHLCGYSGWALFLDADILVRGDITELFALADDQYAVMVSRNPIKFEWASVMLFNCDKCRILTREFVSVANGLHQIIWTKAIGDLPGDWNHLVGYDAPNPDAKLVHYTQGVPAFEETRDCEHAEEWIEMAKVAMSYEPWINLMGRSVHAANVNGTMMPRYKAERLAQ